MNLGTDATGAIFPLRGQTSLVDFSIEFRFPHNFQLRSAIDDWMRVFGSNLLEQGRIRTRKVSTATAKATSSW